MIPWRGIVMLTGVLLTLSACTTHEVGQSVYRALEHNKCLEEQGSHAVCARPAPQP
ncbi:MAG: hypothetical protein HQM00_02975 [Magnetococcales bacterium]|nr:hypothetical protein [Magnetococcales bacterium]